MPDIQADMPKLEDPYFSNEPEVLRSLITQARERAAKWQTKFYEAEASHTEARGMLCQERDAALKSFSEAKSPWVSVEELPPRRYAENPPDFPPISIDVMFYKASTLDYFVGHYDFEDKNWWVAEFGFLAHVTHWMPLPEAPK